MPNNSATGGYLQPSPGPQPWMGQALNRFLQEWVVGLTGLDPTLVRPRYQAEPANIPNAGEAWAAIGITNRRSDSYPAVVHDPTGDGSDQLQRHETFTLACSFYDLGTNGQADTLASLMRDNALIAQNREPLYLGGMALIDIGELTAVPSLLKERWLYRVDVSLTMRREITRNYPVLNLLKAQGTLNYDTGLSVPFSTP